MYGRGLYSLDNIRIENGELMIDCVYGNEGGVRTIKMGPQEAQRLVDEIWHTAENYRKDIRWRLANG
tara:strand:+ start:417 stop:617 length:201 start_codon:yes stop_codon:yes gene_type:complete